MASSGDQDRTGRKHNIFLAEDQLFFVCPLDFSWQTCYHVWRWYLTVETVPTQSVETADTVHISRR